MQLISSDLTLSSVSTSFLTWKWLASNCFKCGQLPSKCSTISELEMQYRHTFSVSKKDIGDVTQKNKIWYLISRPPERKNMRNFTWVISEEGKVYEDRFLRRINQTFYQYSFSFRSEMTGITTQYEMECCLFSRRNTTISVRASRLGLQIFRKNVKSWGDMNRKYGYFSIRYDDKRRGKCKDSHFPRKIVLLTS